jgi:hypothetical protein
MQATLHAHDHPGPPHSPTSVIGGNDHRDEEGQFRRAAPDQEIHPAVHTPPVRLSAGSGEKMNQFAELGNHKSQIEDRNSKFENGNSQTTRWLDDPLVNRKSKIPNHAMAR